MIVLDTNIVGELMRDQPNPAVLAWIDAQNRDAIWLNAVSVYETRFGLAALPAGSRKKAMELAFATLVDRIFLGRVSTLDLQAADAAGAIAVSSRRRGRTMDVRDAMIAGIALTCGATLATRNIRHFQIDGLRVVDPFAA
jgi:predicted nucleic acid-binding protein